MSHMSALFCRSAERLNISAAKLQTLHLEKVCMSVRGHCCVRASDLPSLSSCPFWNNSGQATADGKSSNLQEKKVQKHKDCYVPGRTGGCIERQTIKFRANLLSLYQGTDWLGFVYACSKVCGLLPCKRLTEERMTRQTARM